MNSNEPVSEDQVHAALDTLVALEPDPDSIQSSEDYHAAMAPHAAKIDTAMKTIRRFAEEGQPSTLEQMQRDYYGFTNNPRHLQNRLASGVVTSALRDAWDGIGPWKA